MRQKSFHLITFGCQMNRSDSERIEAYLAQNGYLQARDIESAGLLVVNMCSVRQAAADRVFGLGKKIAGARKNNRGFVAVLTGCVTGTDKKKFAKLFDFIFDIKSLPNWLEAIEWKKDASIAGHFKINPAYGLKYSVCIPISEGCDNYCSYCVVPYTRGPLRARNFEDIVTEAKRAVKNGAKEIWLLGQNVNNYRYRRRNGTTLDFADILEQVNGIKGDFWIRFTSPHPKDFNDRAVNAMAKCLKVTPYLNLPIQSGDNEVLRAMARPYTVSAYKTLVKKIRSAFRRHRQGLEKNVAVSTDVIVGFPGETKANFENSARAFKSIKYDMAYIAMYSPRPDTLAEKMHDNVARKEKKRRYDLLTKIMSQTARKRNEFFVGKTIGVLVEQVKKSEKGGLAASGKSRHYKTVIIDAAEIPAESLIGTFVNVKITAAKPFGLSGTMIHD